MAASKWRLKAGMIETVQYLGSDNIGEVKYFFGKDERRKFRYQETSGAYAVVTRKPSGEHDLVLLEIGDYIVRNLNGEYLVYREDELHKYYERAD